MKNIAVIIETRHQDVRHVINQHLPYLPGWECEHVKNVKISSGHDYNRLLTSKDFWNRYAEYYRVLLFQHDSGLLRKGIDDFLEWDYVGAPWREDAPWARPDRKGGNGGLSLRNPRMMVQTLQRFSYDGSVNEDVFYCRYLERVGGKIAPYEVCARFSCETEFCLGTLGYHAIDKHHSQEQVNEILSQYEHILSQ